ncbi:hypothetical protein Sjap_020066 [Stephania japonica]|uniref:Uncharacterized protein n=1 Tax=Stephania japonica TaxID=461633 RepID=A0AAP0F5I6_9MAGN
MIAHGMPNYDVVHSIFEGDNKDDETSSGGENEFKGIPKKKQKHIESLLENLACKVDCIQEGFHALKCDFSVVECDIGNDIKTMHEKLDMLLKQTPCATNGNASRKTKSTSTSNEDFQFTNENVKLQHGKHQEFDTAKDVDEVCQATRQDYTPHVMKFAQENEIEGKSLENLLDNIPHWFGIVKGRRKRKKASSCLEPYVDLTAKKEDAKEK